jgi:anthranilate phosphoribosyltransferase
LPLIATDCHWIDLIFGYNQPGAARDIVMINAGAALYAANVASSIADGLARAKVAIESGAAKAKLAQFVAFGQKAA